MLEERLEYLSNQVMPKLKEEWSSIKNIQFEQTHDKKGQDQYQSIAIFGDIIMEFDENQKGQIESLGCKLGITEIGNGSIKVPVLIKLQICDRFSLTWTNGGLNFFNEIFFYNDILPYFNTKVDLRDTFPEMIHGYFSDENKEEDIVILKNLDKDGFRLTSSKTVQSLEHILVALKKLGRFHASSYILKSLDKNIFIEKINTLKRTKTWIDEPENPVFGYFQKGAERPAAYVGGFPEYKEKLAASGHADFYANLNTNVPKIYEQNDKMSVLCHGDFNRNNMLFKYEPNADANGTPVDVKFFDMADVIYGTPVLDLSFFLFMNTSLQMKQHNWEHFLQTYHDSVQAECAKFENVAYPSFEDICEEFKVNCMLGYMVSLFLLPMMMEKKMKDRSEWTDEPTEEEIAEWARIGGEEANKAVGELLMFILDKGYI